MISRFSFLFLFAISCNEQSTEIVFVTPHEQWSMHNIHDYTIEQTRSCFCVNSRLKVKITVRSDTIYSVVKFSDASPLNSTEAKYYRTVDSLFGLIEYSQADSIAVTYNNAYGYPERLDIDPQLNPVDGGVLFETGNLQPVD